MAMEDCCEETFEIQHMVRSGTRDFPRMSKVIQNERVFLLVTEGLVKKHQRALADEMETTVSELIARAEQGLVALQKKEAHLQTKLDSGAVSSKPAGTLNAAQKSEARKVKLLTVQRESLEKQVQALEEEVMLLEAKARKK